MDVWARARTGFVSPLNPVAIITRGRLLEITTESFPLDAEEIRAYFKNNIVRGKPQFCEFRIIEKDPDEKDLFFFDWIYDLVPTESISASVIEATEGIVIIEAGTVEKIVPVRISGGQVGSYKVTNRITTSLDRILEKSFRLAVKDT